MLARRAAVLFLGLMGTLSLEGCDQPVPIEPVRVKVDLTPCLGAIAALGGDLDGGVASVPSTCRDTLDQQVAGGLVNACFVMRELRDGALPQRLPLHWEDGQLTEPFPERHIDIPPGLRLEASLFFLSESDENGSLCDSFEVSNTCEDDGRCVLRLNQPEVIPSADGQTVFDFTVQQGAETVCNSDTGAAFGSGSVEVCDGMDNDCDRIVDEAIPGTEEACETGVGACNSGGTTVCDPAQGMVICNAVAGAPGDERQPVDTAEACASDDETCCDGVDDDCDGVADENQACTPCAGDEECAENVAGQFCVDGFCEACNPNDHAGCGENDLCCGTGPDTFECQPTSFGPTAGNQCAACGEACVALGEDGQPLLDVNGERIAAADGCSGRGCSCGFGGACEGPTPFCIGGQCLQCRGNEDCGPQELCCNGTCQPTSPEGQCNDCGEPCNLDIANRCVDRECKCGDADECGGARATCIPNPDCEADPGGPSCSPRAFVCEECLLDNDCALEPTEQACVDQQCRECKDDIDIFCENAGLLRNEGRGQCVVSDCFECDPRNYDGCAEDGDSPICDADDNSCRECESDEECGVRPGDRDQCVAGRCVVCDPETFDGCSDALAPVCDGASLDCRACANNDECLVISPEGLPPKVCVDSGECRGCVADTNFGCDPIGPTPICNDETLSCRGCLGDEECPSVGPDNPDRDRDGDGPLRPASESPFCVDLQCRECDPNGHRGCEEDSARPICLGGNCQPCERDADCIGRPGDLDQCIPDGAAAGLCKLCDPADNAGCDDPANPICDAATFTCVPCGADPECNRSRDPGLPPIECVDGSCSECDPRPGELNIGCDPLSDVPFCDADRAFCRRCASSSECVALDDDRGLDVNLRGCVEGDCTPCDPVTQDGCPDTQVCGDDGRCRACAVDADDPLNLNGDQECALGPGDRDQCVEGRCEVCDPEDFTGCDPTSGQPVCDAETVTCQGCGADGECVAGPNRPANPVGPECVAGFCRVCDPTDGAENSGCIATSSEPFCDPNLFDCAPCGSGVEGDDANCEDNPVAGLRQCIGERCAECDPNNHDGCGEAEAEPFCDAGRAVCRVCNNDAECNIRPGNRDQCVGGQCVVCDPADDAGCNNPNAPVCDARDRTCRACDNDGECPGALLCVTGRCVGCDPDDNDGCDVASATPFCDPGNNTCRACTLLDGEESGPAADTECVDAALPQCVTGSCEQCDPNTHDGCTEEGGTPFCGADGVCRACANNAECVLRPGSLDYCSAGECVQCNRDTEAGCPGDRPVCDDDNQTCRRCRNDGECTGGQECVDGTCVGCDPGSNDNCDPVSTAPFCDPATTVCRGCQNDGECDDPDNGAQCYSERCVECDPSGAQQVGCDVTGAEPFCASDGACRACRNDAECEIAPGARDQCVGGECELCDPADDAGCVDDSDTPVCNAGNRQCRACNADAECDDNPNGNQCVSGACVVCDPDDDAGCDPNGATPTCNAQSLTCVGCGADADCRGNDNGDECVDGACEQCDPANADGCAENSNTPICNAATKTCQACANGAECTLRPGDRDVCVTPNCRICDPADNAGCAGIAPICQGGNRCRGCRDNAECGDNECLDDGSCAGCNPETNAGCDRDNPICDAANEACRPCRADAECGDGFCFEGRCEVCDPEGHAGCGDDALCCLSGQIFACVATDPDTQCAACGTACDADGDPVTNGTNTCANRTCRCGPLVECDVPQPFCLGDAPDGVCSECRDNDDCTANGTTPICGADIQGNDSNTCRGCQNDDDCVDHGRGPQCIAAGGQGGACHVCDPTDNAGCVEGSNQPVCDDGDFTCRGCANDGECAGNGNGEQCVAGRCQACDPGDDAGCDQASETPVCIAGNVCGCAADGDCSGNPNGEQCVGGICADCDPDAVNNGAANGGCDLDGNAPYCDPATLDCVGCGADDNRCENNPNGALCDTNRCVECLIGPNHDGCNADELCCDNNGRPECGATADNTQCEDCGQACGALTADSCVDRGCACGAGAECGAGEVCEAGACVDCRVGVSNVDCNNGELCVAGDCQLCDPNDLRGCDTDRADGCDGDSCTCGADAQCALGQFCVAGACVECQADADCAGDPAGNQCVAGACEECDQADNAGCDAASNDPVCGPDDTCVECLGNADCDPASNTPICNNNVCEGCANDGECDQPGRPICNEFSGECEACEAGTNLGCDPDELCCGIATPACVPTDNDRCTRCFGGACDEGENCVDRVCQ